MPRYTPWAKRIEHPRIELPRVEHPLIAHAADVAACAHVLLTQSLLARRLAAFANQDTLNASQIDALTRLAAWHDLGKCNHKFQSGRGGHVGEIIDLFRAPTHRPQGKRLADALPRDLDEPYFYAAFAHHGWPKNRNDRNDMALWAPKDGYDPLDEIERIIQASARWCPQADFSALPENEALVHALNGLITLADWVGSDTRFFHFEPEADADARYHASLARAEAAMRQIGLISPTRPAAEGLTFSAISPFPPRAAQAALWDLPTTAPSLTILEAATGSGKTEAALGRFLQLFAAGEVDGLYFALPTRAAATQLHRRVYQAIQRALGPAAPPVILAVPGYHRVDEADGHALPDYKVRWDDPQDRLRGWASEHSKRFLGAAIAVGTIDQALLSALQVKHTHLRGLPLLRNLLVVDEVHASDVYMARLLKAVLNRQIKAGGHALLLSATLGAQRRLELLNAERSLKKKDKPKHAEARVAAYPLLTYRAGDAQGQIAPGDVTTPKAVRLQPRPWMDDHAALAQAALAHAARGARVLIIRNTVNDCRQTQIALEALDPAPLLHCQGVPTCHHARYAPSDRQLLDAAVEAALDPHRPAPQPGAAGVIIVATQTVEQSLDIDADHLITDLCPMDVLLQRVGRLQRHARPRPQGFERATVEVLTPAARDLSLYLTPARGRATHGLGTVYADLRYIEAAWAVIEDHPEVEIPRDARALVEDATHPERLAALAERSDAWRQHARERAGQGFADQATAEIVMLDWFKDKFKSFSSDGVINARLGELDRLIKLKPSPIGPFGAPISALKIPQFLLSGVDFEGDEAESIEAIGDRLLITAGVPFIYDRLGLSRHVNAPKGEDQSV